MCLWRWWRRVTTRVDMWMIANWDACLVSCVFPLYLLILFVVISCAVLFFLSLFVT